jgi:hypothetical protein
LKPRSPLLIFVKGPFNVKITSDYLLITQIACIPTASRARGRNGLREATPEPTALFIRGAKPQTLIPATKKKSVPLPKLFDYFKRQLPTNVTDSSVVLSGEPLRLVVQLNTIIFSIGLVNAGLDLGETCVQLQSANAILDLARVAINATQASAIVCAASLPDAELSTFNQTLLAKVALGLLGVQIAANSTGNVDTSQICSQLDLGSLPDLGVDSAAVQGYVCGTDNATSTTASVNSTITASVTTSPLTKAPSVGTLTPFPLTNSSGGIFTGGGSIVTRPAGTGLPPSGTGFFPTGNVSVITGAAGSGTAIFGTGSTLTESVGTSVSPSGTGFFPIGNASVVTGMAESGTAIFGTGSIPTATASLGQGDGINGTNNRPAGTGSIGNDTVVGTSGIPSASVNGTGGRLAGTGVVGTGVVGTGTGMLATGDASAGRSAPSIDSTSSSGAYEQQTSEHVPRGPTSTPRYYPRYF